MHFFEYLISLTSFEYHPPHLHIEFVVNFIFHLFVHEFHELLDDVFDVLKVGAFVELVLKGLVDAHNVGRFAEGYVAAIACAGLLLCGDYLEYVEDKAKHAVLPGHADQFFGLDVLSAEDLEDLVSELVDYLVDVELFPKGLVLLEQSIDELVDGDVVVEIEVFLDEDDGLLVSLSMVLQVLVILEEPPSQHRRILPPRGLVQYSTLGLAFC